MGKNFKSNKKHTWMNSTTLALFPLLFAFPQDYLPYPKNPSNLLGENPLIFFPFYAMHAFLLVPDLGIKSPCYSCL